MHPAVLHGAIGRVGIDPRLCGSFDTGHSDYRVIVVIRSRRSLSDRGERQGLYSI